MNKLLGLLAISLMSLIACNKDAIELGVGLLDNETIDVFTDTIPVTLHTVLGDSLPTYRNTVFFDSQTHPLGRIEDPIFGNSEGIIYLGVSKGFGVPDFENTSIDSLVISIPFDELGKYGDLDVVQEIEVFQLEYPFYGFPEDTLYSNETFGFSTLVGSNAIKANYEAEDTFELIVPQGDTTVTVTAQQALRINLDPAIGQAILDDTLIVESDTTLWEFIKGFALKANGTTNSMMGLDLSDTGGALLSMYYTKNDDNSKRLYNFDLGDIRYINLDHEYGGSQLESDITLPDPVLAEYNYIQSMAGTNLEVDLSSVEQLRGKLINRVQLELTIADVPGDDTIIYPPIENIFGTYRNDEDDLALISDITALTESGFELSLANIGAFFGGTVAEEIDDNGVTYRKYFFNLTNHVQEILEGEIDNTTMTLVAFNKQERVNRSIIHGNSSGSDMSPKLKVVLTDP